MKIRDSNWRTAAAASAICLVLIVAIAILSAKPSSDAFLKRPSTFFTDPSGARAIYLVLQRVQVGGYPDRDTADQVSRQLATQEQFKAYVRSR